MAAIHKHVRLSDSELESGKHNTPVPQQVLDCIRNVLLPYEDLVPWEGVCNAIISPSQHHPEKEQPQEKILSTEELCELLHVSRVTIHRYKVAGKIKAHKLGRRNLYSLAEVQSALKGGCE